MSSQRQVNFRDLVEEGKKRIVILVICVVGLSYLMSLTSSSVLVNLPAAASLIILLRYFSLDFEMWRKAAAYNNKPSSENLTSPNKPPERPKVVARSDWRRNINSPVVENAIDRFTRHIVSEWVTDLWYSRLTPDKEGPEELVQIINGVFGEFSGRTRNINIIELLTRDLVNLICTHLELFRACQAKIEKQHSEPLTIEHRDIEIRRVLAAENKLHPALFSAEAEHKVLQCLMDSLISFTFSPQDLQCSFFRYIVRELLACAIMRPALNLASPRFINERIESLAISKTKAKGFTTAQETSRSKPNGSSKISTDHFSRFLDPSVTGVELVQLKNNQPRSASVISPTDNQNGYHLSKDPLLSLDTRSTRSWGSLPMNSETTDEKCIQRHHSGGEWADKLDLISRRKTQALAPEHFENMWTKGRNYKRKNGENQVNQQHSVLKSASVDGLKAMENLEEKYITTKVKPPMTCTNSDRHSDKLKIDNSFPRADWKKSNGSSVASYLEDEEEVELGSSSYASEDEETDSATGLDSPGIKVWDGKSNRNLAVSHIHHPLENPNGHISRKTSRRQVQCQKLSKTQPGRKRSRLSSQKLPVWQEVERTSFFSGDGKDILSSRQGHGKVVESSYESESEILGRSLSAADSCSSASFVTLPESRSSTVNSVQSSLMVDSYFKLRSEVLVANIVKSDSRTFAVYSIAVTDANNNCWSIKRRFRHFEELHRRLKLFQEYNLHLPPKHFLSTGLDVSVIKERCKLLDSYLKNLLQLPTVCGSIEVWDFLSVDSQTYAFSNSFSIVETFSVDLEDKPSEKGTKFSNSIGNLVSPSSYTREHLGSESKESTGKAKENVVAGQKFNANEMTCCPVQITGKEPTKALEDSRSGLDSSVHKSSPSLINLGKPEKGRKSDRLEETSESLLDCSTEPTLLTEWVPPNLSVPILDLVDVIFQLQDGGWIRRKAFWVAKQVLQLGMGDAFDEWLIEKIQLLCRGSVIASGINRLEQMLWPDGIFLTKHPKRRQAPPSSPSQGSPHGHQPAEISPSRSSEEQKEAADHRAKFVYELMIEKAPAPIVGLVGRKEYEQCAKDLFFFIQSSVCLKHLAFDLLELLLLSACPEMDYAFKRVHEEKHRFGEFKE